MGAEVAARRGEAVFFYLDAPIHRVAALDTPLPCASALERVYVPTIELVVKAAKQLVLE
ncbi:MAG TPA: transketolase C-terminal domain-containing protein [Anaerolineae bacterium]|nr:transketolase C-terminal domain-containing protein [Anaerolineae bacterium]